MQINLIMIHYISPIGIGSAWVGNEIAVITKHDIPVVLHSLRASNQKFFQSEWAQKMDAATRTIYPIGILRSIGSVLLAPVLFKNRFWAAFRNALFGKRESFRNRLAALFHFFVACDWARSLREENISHIHSQWIHSGGTVGMYGAWLLDKPFSFTGHAADLYRERVALEDKISRADFIVCISEFHKAFFLDLDARPDQLHIVYCGIDVTHFSPATIARQNIETPHIVSSGRLVEKKGFLDLVDACRLLTERGVPYRCTIGGSGPQEPDIRERIRHHGLERQVTVTGKALTQEELPDFMRDADIYALPCIWAQDGDVDGLPQMLMEAMSCEVPAVSTNLVGIPDLIVDGQTGLLVEPGDSARLADAIQRLVENPNEARTMAAAGRERVLQKFEINTALQPLIKLFENQLRVARSRS
jgi:glycosyltransferase involved in cell wall biosynthesis